MCVCVCVCVFPLHLIVFWFCALQLLVTVVLNKVSALLAMIGLALYAWDLMSVQITSSYYYGDMNVIILCFL